MFRVSLTLTLISFTAAVVDLERPFDCNNMQPLGSWLKGEPEKRPSPFEIVVSRGTYRKGDHVHVEIRSNRDQKFTTFFIQARLLDRNQNQNIQIGQWLEGTTGKHICGKHKGSLMSKTKVPMSNVKLEWVAPDPSQGHIHFRATFVDDQNRFWVRETSAMIRDPRASPIDVATKYEPSPPIEPVATIGCGTEKGCYRVPAGCWEKDCMYLFTWADRGNEVEFEISVADDGLQDRSFWPFFTKFLCGIDFTGWCEVDCLYLFTWADRGNEVEFEISVADDGLQDRWAAAALSSDKYMGDDSVMECVQDAQTGKVEVFLSEVPKGARYAKRLSDPKDDISHEEGSYYSGKIRCRFTRVKYKKGPLELKDNKAVVPEDVYTVNSDKEYHILMARGAAHDAKMIRHEIVVGVNYPVASSDKVRLDQNADIGGIARYHLVKAHACIMLFAWIFCGTIGLLMVKFYKPMWPNESFWGEKYWFSVHRSCMVTVVVAVLIAFILIVVECGGYSRYPDLPGKAHPILGIIVTICIIINPILALLRPHPDHKCRSVFNWFHFFFGLVANILAVVNIFIGMGFGKMVIPYWATWIVMLYFLFNLIIEVMLEVHMCITHKKNKERNKDWDKKKAENPKHYIPKPDPAGHRFKRNVLYTHVTVTTIVTIILVITFAVC